MGEWTVDGVEFEGDGFPGVAVYDENGNHVACVTGWTETAPGSRVGKSEPEPRDWENARLIVEAVNRLRAAATEGAG